MVGARNLINTRNVIALSAVILVLSMLIFGLIISGSVTAGVKYKVMKYLLLLITNTGLIFASQYIWNQLVKPFPIIHLPSWCKTVWKVVLIIFLATSQLSTVTSFIIGKEPTVFGLVSWTCFGAYIILFLLLLCCKFLLNLLKLLRNDEEAHWIFQSDYTGGIVIFLTLIFTWHAYLTALSPPVIISESILIDKLPSSMNGTKLVLLSDIHLGPTVGYTMLRDVVQRTNSLKPDIVVLAGDLADGTLEQLEGAAIALKDLVAPGGLYFATGNHDYYTGDVDNWFKFLSTLGFHILHNSNVKIRSKVLDDWFCLLGTDDLQANRIRHGDHGMNLSQAYSGCDKHHAAILVAHQPKAAKLALQSQFPIQLVLSGHTHGGQFFPVTIGAYLSNPYLAGLYKYDATSYVYVTQGTFYYAFPLRFGTRREITDITLLSSK